MHHNHKLGSYKKQYSIHTPVRTPQCWQVALCASHSHREASSLESAMKNEGSEDIYIGRADLSSSESKVCSSFVQQAWNISANGLQKIGNFNMYMNLKNTSRCHSTVAAVFKPYQLPRWFTCVPKYCGEELNSRQVTVNEKNKNKIALSTLKSRSCV